MLSARERRHPRHRRTGPRGTGSRWLARLPCSAALALLASSSLVHAEPAKSARSARPKGSGESASPRAIHEPVRLTAGASSELMGVLSPDERSLYFVSDATGTLDLMRQSPVQSGPVTFSSGLGDAVAPQVSPDGTHLAYLSFQSDATGDVCVRRISAEDAGRERCLTGTESAELHVSWWDAESLAVLSRRELHGDFELRRLSLDGRSSELLIGRNMLALALSPDRRWLAYVPLERASTDVGITFAQRTAIGIGLQRLDVAAKPAAPLVYVPPLPGVTGSVAFDTQGAQLVFTQFLNDTNRDGNIDGDDHAVLFRVPFDGASAAPIAAAAEPEQLTSARWDCHYPAPAPSRLIASCSHEGSLDVYELPLAGAVPVAWDDARLAGEMTSARDLWTRLLLAARRLWLARDPARREQLVLAMTGLHLALGEHESAIYYAERRLSSVEGRALGHVIAELARHRRADLALIRGETSEEYVHSERARARGLEGASRTEDVRTAALARLVISEIEDDIGDKSAALARFEAVDVAQSGDPLLAPLIAERARRLYRQRGDRERLLAVYATLASLPALDTGARLEHAARFVEELGRGRGRGARRDALGKARALAAPGGELALLLDVEERLLELDDATQEAVRAELFELYKDNKDPDRRRALVLAALQTAAKAGNEYLQYQFVTSWASSVAQRHPERKYAEALYDAIVLDRAYGEGRQGERSEARGYFYGATVATGSLEAHIGFIEARLAEGVSAKELDALYEKRFLRDPGSPIYSFVKAYRSARELPREQDLDRHEERVSEIVTALAKVAEVLPKQVHVHQLWGFALHQRARRSGSREAAVDANRQYLLALDLAREDERATAAILHRLGLLQASLGNHGAALRYLLRRAELPHVRPLEELGLNVAIAQSAWHQGDAALARARMLRAAEQVEEAPELARYAPLVTDRLALALTAAGDAARARREYERLADMLDRDPSASPGNRVRARVGLAASALESGDPAAARRALITASSTLDSSEELEPAPEVVWRRSLIGQYRYTRLQYQALVAGLRAEAERALGDAPAALTATQRRVSLLEQRLQESDADEDRLELAQAYHHLARSHHARGDFTSAARAVERGLELSDAFDANTGSDVNDAGLALLRDYAELHLRAKLPHRELRRDLHGDLRRAYAAICKYRSPRWARQRFLFKAYLTELALAAPAIHLSRNPP